MEMSTFNAVLESSRGELSRYAKYNYVMKGIAVRISVPVHTNKPLKLRLLRHLMKVAEITETEL